MCPFCKATEFIIKSGTYTLSRSSRKIQRYFCGKCYRRFSDQTSSFDYRLKKRRINQPIFRMLAKGSSQRGCAQVLGLNPKTVARRVIRFGRVSKAKLEEGQKAGTQYETIMVDEMESFEHTKLKPLTIPIAVDKKTRKILDLDVGKIGAKGHLVKASLAKYGKRKSERRKVLAQVFGTLKGLLKEGGKIISDESPHYPYFMTSKLKGVCHLRFKGGRGAIVGQGELKKKGFDPLFQLNHTFAMIRDNIKRLSRRTWCTTKIIERLKDLLYIYSNYHNQIREGVARPFIGNSAN